MPKQPIEEWPAGTLCRCLRCSHEWRTRKPGKPVACGKCKTTMWSRPRQLVPHAARGMGTEAVE